MTSFKPTQHRPHLLAALHQQLGIPESYAAERGLAPQPEAAESELVEVGLNEVGRPIRLIEPAAEAWANMRHAAAWNHVELVAISGFRAIARQAEIFQQKLTLGQRPEEILRYLAAPGFSEHHTGRALDIGSPEYLDLNEEFARTAAFQWLEAHAPEFGFNLSYPLNNSHGIVYEPWHWCWRAQFSSSNPP